MLVSFEIRNQLAGVGIPEFDLDDQAERVGIAATGGYEFAVGRDGQSKQGTGMSSEGDKFLACFQVPEFPRAVRAPGCDFLVVRRKSDDRDIALMTLKGQ